MYYNAKPLGPVSKKHNCQAYDLSQMQINLCLQGPSGIKLEGENI